MDDYTIEKLWNHVLVFTITRGHVHNAVNYNVIDGLNKACEQVEKDTSISLLTITAEGEHAFCAGGDLQEFHSLQTSSQSIEMLQRMTRVLFRITTLPVPVIGLLNGTAVGGGMEIATACDIRYANENGKFGFIQANLAITTGWGGGTLLFEKFPQNLAMEWLINADKREAKYWFQNGFFNGLFSKPSLQFFKEQYHSIIFFEAEVLRAYKQQYVEKLDQSSLLNRMLEEAKKCSILWEKDAHHKAVEKFLQKKGRN